MHGLHRYWPAVLFVAISHYCNETYANEPAVKSTADLELREALSDLHLWLGRGENGKAWRRYLRADSLQNELDRGDSADPQAVDAALEQYESEAAGLERPRFARVRAALRRWRTKLASPTPDDLPAAIAEQAQQPQLAEAEQLEQARTELVEALGRLDEYLTPGGANGAAWKTFLRFDELNAAARESDPDPQLLDEIGRRFAPAYPGLELDVFADVAAALDRYVRLALPSHTPEFAEHYPLYVERLATELKAYDDEATPERLGILGQLVGWLNDRGQLPQLVGAVQRSHRRPNLWVQISDEIARAGTEETVDDTQPVRDVILGTQITGTGHTRGRVTAELVPDERRLALDILFGGNTRSNTVGVNGPARIWSVGNTELRGRQRLWIDEYGLSLGDGQTDATTRTKTTGLSTKFHGIIGRLADRIAWKKVAEKKSAAERIGSRKAASRLDERLDDQVSELLATNNENYWSKVRRPLVEREQFPWLRFRTLPNRLNITALQAAPNQLAASSDPPTIDDETGVALRVHESALNNLFAGLFSGVTVDRETAKEQLIETLGKLPERFDDDEDKEEWSITFAQQDPIVVRFIDDGFHIMVRGRAYTSGDRQYQGMNVAATYKLVIDPETGLKGIRQGELEIFPPDFVQGKRRLSIREQTLRNLLQRRFGKILAEELVSEERLKLPGRWSQAGELVPVVLSSRDGWLALGWNATGVDSQIARPTPAAAAPVNAAAAR